MLSKLILNKSISSAVAVHTAANRAFVTNVIKSVNELPMREALRYTGKNVKWTAQEFKSYADAHTGALLEYGFTTDDSIAVWLDDSAEKHVTIFAAAQLGIKVYDIDSSITNKDQMREILKSIKCKSIYFEPQTATLDKALILRQSIPELFYYNNETQESDFHSKHFPELKYFIHTGFDLEEGFYNFKRWFKSGYTLDTSMTSSLSDDKLFYTHVSKNGVKPTVSLGKARSESALKFADALISKVYLEAP